MSYAYHILFNHMWRSFKKEQTPELMEWFKGAGGRKNMLAGVEWAFQREGSGDC